MSIVTCDMAVSVDGYTAGTDQRMDAPFGDGAEGLTTWMLDEPQAHAAEIGAITAAGAFVMGRNMFGPGRGGWDLGWTGWWGAEPPYHAPVFVLTHHAREDLPMEGGTTFHFVTGGVDEAVARAREAAGDRDVAIAGGAATVNQCLAAGVVDELRLHVAPVLLGRGERLFEGVPRTGLVPVSVRQTPLVTHLTYAVARAQPSSRSGDDARAQ
ncbi:dihydrofolate reductase family protein [Pseudonocardia sp. KRD291]|uniref:dihydrofolate reductase family protein n=1 Tax=Pseudonocardia sp. KRD291 TaxID=2792007 RepID=UPI001C4A479E|nr:dihydrofolate reductase family protein [Pseudonocardia sp. KRD291]MBW0105812.1 dihydrofolate reductase family protein [Pseudonocardia sp. KRD291]